tara:strand:- start:294 stop:797 length:504 start_codon:yes stop_codon:yes gene_type:complete
MVPGARFVEAIASGTDDPSQDFRFKVQASASGLFVKEGTRFIATDLMEGLWSRHFSTFPALKGLVALQDRETPLQFEGHREEFQLHVVAPKGRRIDTILGGVRVETRNGEVRASQNVSVSGNRLTLTRSFDAMGAIVDTDEYAEFRRDVLKFEEAMRGTITLVPKDP